MVQKLPRSTREPRTKTTALLPPRLLKLWMFLFLMEKESLDPSNVRHRLSPTGSTTSVPQTGRPNGRRRQDQPCPKANRQARPRLIHQHNPRNVRTSRTKTLPRQPWSRPSAMNRFLATAATYFPARIPHKARCFRLALLSGVRRE